MVEEGPFLRGRIYQGGNVQEFQDRAGVSQGERVLYIGDHIYGDMLRAKKSSVWRTAMILQELEDELLQMDHRKTDLEKLDTLERQCARLDSEITYQQHLLKSLQRLESEEAPVQAALETVEAAK